MNVLVFSSLWQLRWIVAIVIAICELLSAVALCSLLQTEVGHSGLLGRSLLVQQPVAWLTTHSPIVFVLP